MRSKIIEKVLAEAKRRGIRLDADQEADLVESLQHKLDCVHQLMTGVDRLDANETAVLARQLEQTLSKEMERRYTPLRALLFFPLSTELDPGTETWRYEMWDEMGMAKIISNYADDLPLVDIKSEEFFGRVQSLGDAYQYSRQDLRRAAKTGRPLNQRKRRAARRAYDRKVDDIASTGDAAAGLPGFLNHKNIPIIAAADPASGSDTSFTGGDKTPKEIVLDLNRLARTPFSNTNENWDADALLLPPTELDYIRETPYGTEENSDSILTVFLKNNGRIRNVDSWSKLATADAAGTGPRAAVYRRDPEVVELHLPMPFTEHEPQVKNLAFVVPCEGRIAGIFLYEPLACAFMDGI